MKNMIKILLVQQSVSVLKIEQFLLIRSTCTHLFQICNSYEVKLLPPAFLNAYYNSIMEPYDFDPHIKSSY